GNGVFHPADFAVLNANVAPQRLGHAYSTHGVGGSIGYAIAPIVSYGLGSAFGWRTALLTLGALGLVAVGAFALPKDAVRSRPPGVAAVHHSLSGSVELFRQAPILLCFTYFCILTLATIGIQTFAGPALNAAYAIPIALATSALAAYLLGSTAGIFVGGFLAAPTPPHHPVAPMGLSARAGLVAFL